jgi:hypothetical protein
LVEELTCQGQRARVFDGLSVEGAVVNTEAKGTIGFAGKEDGSSILRDARSNPTFLQVDLKLFLKLLKLSRGHAVDVVLGRDRTRLEINAVEGTSVGHRGWLVEGGAMCVVQETMEGLLVDGGESGGGKERVGLRVCSRGRWSGDLADVAGEELDVIWVFGYELPHPLGRDEVDLNRGRGRRRAMKEEGRGDGVGRPVDLWVDL